MPVHAKILAALLVLNILVGGWRLVGAYEPVDAVIVLINLLMLLGFLKGSEGFRTLLLIAAALSAVGGVFTVIAGLGTLGADPSEFAGRVAVLQGSITTGIGLYMLFALRHWAVTEWMLRRSLGDALDDDAT